MAIQILLTMLQVFGSETVPLVAIRDWFEYNDGNKGKRLGTVYEVLNLASGCEKLGVKVPDSSPAVTQAQLDEANKNMEFVTCKFTDFEAKPYADRSGRLQVSAKASGIKIVPSDNKMVNFGGKEK